MYYLYGVYLKVSRNEPTCKWLLRLQKNSRINIEFIYVQGCKRRQMEGELINPTRLSQLTPSTN